MYPVMARGLRLVVVSNANGRLHHLLERIGLLDAFDHVFDSHHEGVEKPDPRIFRLGLDRVGVRAEEAAMVGDSPEDDIAGARALGMRAFLVDREGRFPVAVGRLPDLLALPAALGLPADTPRA